MTEEKNAAQGLNRDGNAGIVRIFTAPLSFPCGPGAACCGPVGQSEEEVRKLKEAIEKELNVSVEVRNVTSGRDMRDFRSISALVRTFGFSSLPFITVGDEVVAMGSPAPEEAVATIREMLPGS